MKTAAKLWILISVLIILTPFGIMIPGYFKSGGAWGEWSAQELKIMVGYIPRGLQKLSALWNAPIPGYGRGCGAYVISAVVGVIAISGIMFLIGKFLAGKD